MRIRKRQPKVELDAAAAQQPSPVLGTPIHQQDGDREIAPTVGQNSSPGIHCEVDKIFVVQEASASAVGMKDSVRREEHLEGTDFNGSKPRVENVGGNESDARKLDTAPAEINGDGGTASPSTVTARLLGDSNHPGNKPKESLVYSLFCVFSRLSGNSVLSAREALSRIIEQELPGLDEDSGVPSVQVAKVLRSNPYFVHLDGGKFFMCSGPSAGNHTSGLRTSEAENQSVKPAAPSQSNGTNHVGKRDREERGATGQQRNKRANRSSLAHETETGVENNPSKPKVEKKPGNKSIVVPSKVQKSLPRENPIVDGVRICKRYDGRGWKCQEQALDGYSMCRHHHELIVARLARLRSSGRLGSKKPLKKRKCGTKQVKDDRSNKAETIPESNNGLQWRKNVKARSLKSIH